MILSNKGIMATMRYWLMKSEPSCYSIDDLANDKKTCWDGVRNYQARNFLRDEIKKGDTVFYYHSNTKPPGIVGLAEVIKDGYPDSTAFDKNEDHYDPKSKPENPTWFMVDIKFLRKLKEPLSLDMLKADPKLEGMLVTMRGQRLSVMPVSDKHGKYLESFF